jgi:hypothetical protein
VARRIPAQHSQPPISATRTRAPRRPRTCESGARQARIDLSGEDAWRGGRVALGTDVYTGDSAIATAAVHAGLVATGETVVVKVTVEQPLARYQGSVRNGVTSNDFGQYGTAYRLARI